MAAAAIATKAATAAREKTAATQEEKVAFSQQRNQLLKKNHSCLDEMEPSQLQRVVLAVTPNIKAIIQTSVLLVIVILI